jgi:serine/threonine protein kinase
MHRDLKPVNILIGEEKQLKICDFGLSKETKNIEVTGERGTRMYAAP